MTLPVLCSAAEVLYLVTGESKAEAVERAFAEPPSHDAPASLIRSTGGRTRAALDEAAASSLPH
jgi:6-phosphogluconolactonase/glucosamine-6-phosphate isomerase/deaminase